MMVSFPELSPVLAGQTVADLWPVTNWMLPAWLLLAILPRWKYTKWLTLVPPIFHSIIYAVIIIPLMMSSKETADFTSLEGVFKLFQDPNAVFVGWIHYLAFDLLVGRAICMDALERGASNLFYYCMVVPCLFCTCMLGPTGFLLYSIIRTIGLPAPTPKGNLEAKKKNKGKAPAKLKLY